MMFNELSKSSRLTGWHLDPTMLMGGEIDGTGEPDVIAIYQRVSSTGQEFAAQGEDLKTWASNQTAAVKWYEDKFSGTTMDRPGFNALMEDMRSGKVKSVVVWRLDRLGRTASGLTALFDDFNALKVNFVSLKDGIDLRTAAGKLLANVLASVAAFETEIRKERQAAGIAAAKAEGRTWGGRRKGTMQKRTPELDELVKKLKAEGKPITKIARLAKLSRNTVYAILRE